MGNQGMLISLFLLFISTLLATDIPSCNSPELLSREDSDNLFISPLSISNPPVVTVTTKCKHQAHSIPIHKSQVIKYDPSLDGSNETKTHACMSSNINYEDAQIIHSVITSAQRAMSSVEVTSSLPSITSSVTTTTVTMTSSQMSTVTITSSLEVTTTLSSSSSPSPPSVQTITVTESKAPISDEMTSTKIPEVTTSTTTLVSTEFVTITTSSSSTSCGSTSVSSSGTLSSPSLLSSSTMSTPSELETTTTNTLSSLSSSSSESNYKFAYSTSFEPTTLTSPSSTESVTQSQMEAQKFPSSTTLSSSSSLSSLQSSTTTSLSEAKGCNCTSNANITSYSSSTEITSTFMLNIFSFSNITIPMNFTYPLSYFFSYQLKMLQTNVTTINQMATYLQTTNILSAMWVDSIKTQTLITKILEYGQGKFIFDISIITKLLLRLTTTTITNILQKLQIINIVEENRLTVDCFTAMMSVIASGTAIDTCHKNVWYDQIINRHQYSIISVISSMLSNKKRENGDNHGKQDPNDNNWNDIQLRLAVRNYFESIYQNRYYQKYYSQYRERLLHWYENNFLLNSNVEGVNYAKGGIIISAPILPAPGRLCPKTWGLTRQVDPWIDHLPAYIKMAYYTDQSDKPMVYFREETCALCKMKRMGLLAKGEYCYLCKVERVKQRLLEMPGGILQAVFQTLLMMNSPSNPSPHESIPAPAGVSVVVPAPPATIFPLLYSIPSTG